MRFYICAILLALNILYLLWSVPLALAGTLHCYVLSGLDRDWNGALADDPLLYEETSKIGKSKCEILKGWTDLQKTLTKNPVPPGEKIFIYQSAHGDKTGIACVNEGNNGPRDIIKTLNGISKDHPTAASISSCYSGDLMKEKLIDDDERKPGGPLSNLCLMTGSLAGRVMGVSGNSLTERVKDTPHLGESAEEFYKRGNKGLISSAPWSEAGVPEIWKKGEITNVVRTSELLRSFSSQIPACAMEQLNFSQSINQCLSSGISDTLIKKMLESRSSTSWKYEVIGTVYFDVFKRFNCGGDIEELLNLPAGEYPAACLTAWRKMLNNYIENSESKPFHYQACLIDQEAAFSKWAATLVGKGSFTLHDVEVFDSKFRESTPDCADMGLFDDGFGVVADYRASKNGTFAAFKIHHDEKCRELLELMKAQVHTLAATPEERLQTLKSILGISFFPCEKGDAPYEFTIRQDTPTAAALFAFSRGGVEAKEFRNPIDKVRRQACRDFTF